VHADDVDRELRFDPYAENPTTGLVHPRRPLTNATVGAG
jgi:hypothetical protein